MPDHQNAETSSPEPANQNQSSDMLVWGILIGFTVATLLAIVMSTPEVLTLKYWGPEDNKSAVLRNLGLIALGVIGLPLAIWRSWTAHKQTNAANIQAVIANQQFVVAYHNQIVEGFGKGAHMLDSKKEAVQIAGIYVLRDLSTGRAAQIYITSLNVLAAFLREESKKRKTSEEDNKFPTVLQEAINAISQTRTQTEGAADHEANCDFVLDLSGGNFSGADFTGCNYRRTNFGDADLSGCKMIGADLTKSFLNQAKLGQAVIGLTRFDHCDISGSLWTDAVDRLPQHPAPPHFNSTYYFRGSPPIDLKGEYFAQTTEISP